MKGSVSLSTLVPVTHGCQDVPRLRPGDRRARPLVGHRSELDLEVGPDHVEQIFQMLHDLAGVGRGRGHQEILLAEPPGRAVVEHQPVLAQHQPIACLADRQRREDVGVDAVEEIRGVRPLDGDLAERRDIGDAGRLARRLRLAHIGLLDRLARQAVDHRAVPEAGRIHRRAVGDMPVVHRRQPLGPDLAVTLGRQRADRHRREGRAETRRADLGNLLAERVRHDGEAGHVRGLALVGRHAERRVALQMLDGDRNLRDGRGGHRRR